MPFALKPFKNASVSDVEADAWVALFAPAKTQSVAIDRVFHAITNALRGGAAKAVLAARTWAAVIKAAGSTLE